MARSTEMGEERRAAFVKAFKVCLLSTKLHKSYESLSKCYRSWRIKVQNVFHCGQLISGLVRLRNFGFSFFRACVSVRQDPCEILFSSSIFVGFPGFSWHHVHLEIWKHQWSFHRRQQYRVAWLAPSGGYAEYVNFSEPMKDLEIFVEFSDEF